MGFEISGSTIVDQSRQLLSVGVITATSLDISGSVDVDGTLEADAITVDGTALDTHIEGVTVTNATNAANVTITDDTSGSGTHYIHFGSATSSNDGVEVDSTGLVYKDGKLGIGTTNPAEKLDVRGDIIAYTSSLKSVKLDDDGSIELTNNNGAWIDFKTADSEDFDCRIRHNSNGFQFMTGGNGSTAEALRITSDGDVGIGTNAPNAGLDIGSNTPSFRLTDYDSSAGAGTTSYTQLANINGNTYVYTRANENNGSYLIGGHGDGVYDEHVRITPAGDVGIGTGNPTGASAVTGNEATLAVGIVTTNKVYSPIYYAPGGATKDKFIVWSSSAYAIGMDNAMSFGGLNDYAMTFKMNNDDDRGWWWGDGSHNDDQGAMTLNTIGELVVAKSIRAGGGESDTLAPRKPLDIIGDGIISGDVGIGTDSPGEPLRVHKDGLDQKLQRWGGSQGSTAGQRWMDLYTPAEDNMNSPFRFQTGNAIKFRIDTKLPLCLHSTGTDVGMGTDDPTDANALTNNETRLAVGIVTTNSVYGKLNNLTYPTTNGTDGQVLTSDGAGVVQWETADGGASGLWASNATGINTSTNVGIATTTASAMLEIGSSGIATATTMINAKAWDGQTFNVDGNVTSNSIFAVNDISGLPVIDYNATHGKLSLGAFGGNVSIGYTNSGTKLGLKGSTSERVYVSTGSSLSNVTDDQINIDNGNVQYYSVPETGGNLTTVDITSNNTLNVDLAIGDSVTVVVIIKPSSSSDKITGIEIDGTAVTEKWLAGTAPTGGASSSYDVYTFFILKTDDATFLPLCNKVNFA